MNETISNPYQDIQRSLLAFCKNALLRHNITEFQVFDFDTHTVTQSFPDKDLIGVGEYSIENKQDMYHITCMLIVCTKSDDTDLKRLRPVIGALFKDLTPGNTGEDFAIFDEDGVKRGYMTVMDDVMVGTISGTKTRPVQAIAVAFSAGYQDLPF